MAEQPDSEEDRPGERPRLTNGCLAFTSVSGYYMRGVPDAVRVEIEQALARGLTTDRIAERLNVPLAMVDKVARRLDEIIREEHA